ncbi:MAG TPA: hypothetical protein VLI71_02135 [Gammaproteobacteria bacterium]|nr:hypothetical protein [Gammaproteobacteria bacterium]
MRWLRLAAPAALVAAWLAGSVAQQQGTPPAGTPPPARTPPASTPQPSTPRPAAPPAQEQEEARPPAADDDEEDVFVPTEELQPDAAVTFPVDI